MFPESKQLPVRGLLLTEAVHLYLPLFHDISIELFYAWLFKRFRLLAYVF